MSEITPDYIRGLVDGEGCFYILFSKRIACEFQLSQKNKKILEKVKNFFSCGYVKSKYDKSGSWVYVVKDNKSLYRIIVPFFETNPPLIKKKEFEKFAKVTRMIYKKDHLTKKGRAIIKALKLGTSETIR